MTMMLVSISHISYLIHIIVTPLDEKYNYPSPYDKPSEKKPKKYEEEEEIKASDLGENNVKPYIPKIFEEENYDFSVTNPLLQGGHIVYTVKGLDTKGPWEGQRRYSEFY